MELTPEQSALRDVVRAFGLREVASVRGRLESDRDLYRSLVRRVGELGLIAILDGAGEPGNEAAHVTVGVAAEEMARYDVGLAQVISGAGTRLYRLDNLADRQLAAELRTKYFAGEVILTAGYTEAGAGSDIQGLRTTARRVPGGVIINGEKSSVTDLFMASYVNVLAREIDENGNDIGFSQFLVPADVEGSSTGFYEDIGWRARGRGFFAMTDSFVPDALRIGAPGAGVSSVLGVFNYNRAVLGLCCVGATAITIEETIVYTSERMVFGRPLASNQAVSFAVAEAATQLDAARYMCYRVLELRDRGLSHSTESAMAKWWVPQVCADILQTCLRFHGHMGYCSELPIEQRLRDVLGFQIADGPSEVMKLIVARKLFGREVTG